jgi:CRP-like cAMP-binding protein
MDVQKAIENAPIFADLPKKDIKQLCAALTERQIPAGTVIIEQGKPGVGFFVIGSGSASVAIRGEVIGSLKAGDHFGEVALIDDGPRMAEITAETDMECFALPAWEFRAFVKDHPDFAWALMQSLVRQIVRGREADEQL